MDPGIHSLKKPTNLLLGVEGDDGRVGGSAGAATRLIAVERVAAVERRPYMHLLAQRQKALQSHRRAVDRDQLVRACS